MRMSNKRVSQRLDGMLRGSAIKNFRLIDSVEGAAPACVDMCHLRPGECRTAGAAPPTEVSQDLAEFADPMAVAGLRGHVIVCGLGRLGFGAVRLLKGRVPVVVVDSSERLHYADDPVITTAPAVPILRGDMTVPRVLEQAGVARAAAVMVLTPNDTTNLEAAMAAHEANPNARIVMRIANSRIAGRLDGVLRGAFGDTLRVVDPSAHAAPFFVDAVGAALRLGPDLTR
jgi:voltage-gated potassium channel Kch